MAGTTPEAESTPADEPARVDVGEVNLAQALLDFDIANARVIDLTRRLTTLSEQLVEARTETERMYQRAVRSEDELAKLRAELAEIHTSLAYRSFRVVGDSRARWRR